ncbi:hypothetical protein B0F90DRAFT_1825704, partial [Multifurca ochricompacta]
MDSDSYLRRSSPVQASSSSSRGNRLQRGRGQWVNQLLGPKDRDRESHFKSKLRYGNASLSQLLYQDRPLLKPITFVRSKATPTLFLEEEEIFKPVAEESGEQEVDHVPTAERIYRIFHGGGAGQNSSELPSDSEELLEIDFADLGKLTEAGSAFLNKTTGTSAVRSQNQTAEITVEDQSTAFYVDTKPSPIRESPSSGNRIPVDRPEAHVLGDDVDDDEEIIVYVAPHPRNGKR